MNTQNIFFAKKNKWWIIFFVALTSIVIVACSTYWFFAIYQKTPPYVFITNIVCLMFSFCLLPYAVWNFIDSILGLCFYNKYKRKLIEIASRINVNDNPIVAVVIPIYNDFLFDSARITFSQTYQNTKYYILDDSTDEKIKHEIDLFANKYNVVVIRGHNKIVNGQKYNCGLAAAFSNFINKTIDEWEFMVHVDSGDILNPQHVEKNLPFFYANPKLGVLTPCSCGILNKSMFQNLCSSFEEIVSVPGFFQTQYYSRIMPGAGTTYRKNALKELGYWPDFLSEDGAVSLSLVKLGWETMFSNIVLSQQLDPFDFHTYVYRMFRWEKGFYEMRKSNFYNTAKYKTLDLISKINLFISGTSGVLRIPYVWITLFIYPVFCFFSNSTVNIFLYIPFSITIIFPILISLVSFFISWKQQGFKKSLHFLMFALLFPMLLAGCFLVITKCWITSFIMKTKPKFIVTKKINNNNNKILKKILPYLIGSIFIVLFSIIAYYFLFPDCLKTQESIYLYLFKVPSFFFFCIFPLLSTLLAYIILEIYSKYAWHKKEFNNYGDFSSSLCLKKEGKI